eukprot:CAMPEP_0115855486 /NCGR_PEP_ID=MMETSP0287-20121206/14565_1 /TAXON_ID=412157 /ORGANISM="Chrysochromulina rotalis, Strain UIO044" /LENGTH=197 /DNA_ID=CAMNT_0003309637 /DNA_START=445 /DNA_END=1036 /DNA_ORIENTATION=+
MTTRRRDSHCSSSPSRAGVPICQCSIDAPSGDVFSSLDIQHSSHGLNLQPGPCSDGAPPAWTLLRRCTSSLDPAPTVHLQPGPSSDDGVVTSSLDPAPMVAQSRASLHPIELSGAPTASLIRHPSKQETKRFVGSSSVAASNALRLLEHLDGLDAHQVGELARVEVVLVRYVGERLLAAAHRLKLGDADARAVELAH